MAEFATIDVTFQDRTYAVPPGSRVAEIIGRAFLADHQVLGATLNNHLVSLDTTVDADAVLGVVTAADQEGQAIVRRTTALCLHFLLAREFPQWRCCIGQSMLGGYFYEVTPPDQEEVDLQAVARQLDQGLAALAVARLPLRRERASMEAALARLSDASGHKARLLEAWTGASVPLISLGEFVDIQHGPYAADTSCVTARVVACPPGLVLQFEDPPTTDGWRLRESYRETRDWNRLVGITTVGDLNRAILQDRVADVIRVAEALHEKRIAAIADEITRRRPRLVMVAGPSSSGKTTFIKRLEVQLRVNGSAPLCLSLDDYYRPRLERMANEEPDFEAVEALDLELWRSQLHDLLAGREVRRPRYDFRTGLRTDPEGNLPERLRDEQLLLVEGIHGLNPLLAGDQSAFRIFVSAVTQLVIDEHNRVLTSEARLLRRLVRDRRYRGVSAAGTLERWPSVRQGEDRNIFPFQDRADAIFNSALVYEAAMLGPLAWRYLLEVPRSHPARVRAYSLLKFLELFVPIAPDHVPGNSILREFLGGASFQY